MRSLFFASIILVIIFSGCASVKPKNLRPAEELSAPVVNVNFEKVLFKATMEIRGTQITGLLFIKKMPDSEYRIVFSNEFGMTYFDLELQSDSFNVIYCFEPMNKKMLLSLLESDFRLLIDEGPSQNGKWYLQEHTNVMVYHVKHGKQRTWSSFSTNGDTLISQTAFSNFFELLPKESLGWWVLWVLCAICVLASSLFLGVGFGAEFEAEENPED